MKHDKKQKTLITMSNAWARVSANTEYSSILMVADMGDADGEAAKLREMVHQWFCFFVGNNEKAELWLDEGFAVFATISQMLSDEAAINDET